MDIQKQLARLSDQLATVTEQLTKLNMTNVGGQLTKLNESSYGEVTESGPSEKRRWVEGSEDPRPMSHEDAQSIARATPGMDFARVSTYCHDIR
ncbi:MAG: hypothetical protein LQ349_005344 [Xanthoria aureola]|nr:MAG: hypothetical protein LQ349_005344 [Xanthoria aureola]